MHAAVYERFGSVDVVSWRDIPPPSPRPGEVGVRVEAAGLNPKDVLIRKGKFALLSGRRFPKVLGFDVVGRVVELGDGAPSHLLGKRVLGFHDGFDPRFGTLAESTVIEADAVAELHEGDDPCRFAAVPLAGSTALQALRDDGSLRRGERLLVIGASGGVGSFAVPIGKLLGAHVTAVTSAKNAAFVRSLGADDVLAYDVEDDLFRGRYDVVLDAFGRTRRAQAARCLVERGRFVSLVPSAAIAADVVRSLFAGPRTRLTVVRPRPADLAWLATHVREGSLRPMIERVYGPEGVREAMLRLESKHTRGKLVVRVAG